MFFEIGVSQTCNFIKKRLQHRCFLVKLAKFLRTPPVAASIHIVHTWRRMQWVDEITDIMISIKKINNTQIFWKNSFLKFYTSFYFLSLCVFMSIKNIGQSIPLKPLGGSKVDLTFHPSKVDQMSTSNSWGLSDKK